MTIILTLFGLGLAALVAVASLVRFRDSPDRGLWLAALMAALAAQMQANVALATGAILQWPHLAQVHVPLAFAIGPFLYLHTRGRLPDAPPVRPSLHLIVPLFALLLLVPFYLADAETKRAFMTSALGQYPTAWRVRQALLQADLGIYVLASWHVSRRIELTSAVFVWSRGLAMAATWVWAAAALRFVAAYRATTAPFAMAVSTVGLAAVVVAGLATPAVARRRSRVTASPATQEETDCLEAILRQLRDKGIYRSRDVTLERLAAAVGTTPHFLSSVVNARCGTTVPELVNRYRVEEAERMLRDPGHAHRSIQDIAENVGFTSRSAFNAAFKRHAGTTPSALRARPLK